MKTGIKIFTLFALMALSMPPGPGVFAAEGTVVGTISLEMEDGRVESGNWIRILLLSEAVQLPEMKNPHEPTEPDYIDYVNSLHSGFYIRVQNHLSQKRQLVASTLSTEAGTFKISALEPGDYVILITLPGNIHGYKVAWQVPVKVASGKTTTVTLNRSNLALPTVKR